MNSQNPIEPSQPDSRTPMPDSGGYGIPAWLPKAVNILLPSPVIWKQRRLKKRNQNGWNWQFIAPALVLMLGLQSLIIWTLLKPITTPLEPYEEIEIEIPIDLSTIASESDAEPEAGGSASAAPAAGASAAPPAPAVPKTVPVPAPKPATALAPTPAQIIPQQSQRMARAVVVAPSLAVQIPKSAPIAEPAEEQSVPNSEGQSPPERIAPMLERAEQVVDTQITITPIELAVSEPVRPAEPIAIAPAKPDFTAIEPLAPEPEPVKIETARVAVAPERLANPIELPTSVEPIAALDRPLINIDIQAADAPVTPAQAIAQAAPERPDIEVLQIDDGASLIERTAPSTPSVALAEVESASSTETAPSLDANAQAPSTQSDAQPGAPVTEANANTSVRSNNSGSGLDLMSGVAQAAADQAAQNAPRDTRNAFRRYDNPFAEDQPNRLDGLRLREPQLFLDIAKYLVSTLGDAGLQYTLVQLGSNEEIDDFTDVDMGRLIKAWTDLHHGDLTKDCRQNNPDLSPAMREVLCGGIN